MGRYDDRRLVAVNPFAASTIFYGFLTNVDPSVSAALGHLDITGTYPLGLVIGANAPKPPRASRERPTGVESSFVDSTVISAARAAGWKIRSGKIRLGSSSIKSKTVYVSDGTVKYAWNMPLTTYNRVGAVRADLGIIDATPADDDLVFGASYPKMPRVATKEFGTGGVDIISTFCDPQKLNALPAGWFSVRASQSRI